MEFQQKISEELFTQKYMINEEKSPEEAIEAISEEIASAERKPLRDTWKKIFYDEIVSRRFIPGGRILANARPSSKMKNYGNCYVIPIRDSLPEIYRALAEDATISGSGGGVGFNCSGLRPKDSAISKGGESSGPLSFLEVFDASAKTIRNGGGRRSAHISIMDISHPDIEEFISYKQGDTNKKLTQFNISVGISQPFLIAVKEDLDWDLVFNGQVYKTLRARDLFDKIASHAYIHNEPGLLIYPSVDYRNTGWYIPEIGEIRACNPCLTGDSVVIARVEGKEQTTRLVDVVASVKQGQSVEVLSYNEQTQVSEFKRVTWGDKTRKDAKLLKITDTSTGKQIRCTPDHKILTRSRGWVEAQNLLEDDELVST